MNEIVLLPTELKLQILSYLKYDDISKVRRVSKDFNRLCMDALNSGFSIAENMHAQVQKDIRGKLPRRESERRNHTLSRHADILSAIETRMSLLQITYAKYIESGYCCFIPGKVLDELFSVLRFVKNAKEPPRSHEVLMELRDISSMAMEHFEEKILPSLKKQLSDQGLAVLPGGLTVGLDDGGTFRRRESSSSYKRVASHTSPAGSPLSKRMRMGGIGSPSSQPLGLSPFSQSTLMFSQPHTDNSSLLERLAESERTVAAQGQRIDDQERTLQEMSRKLAEYNHRFNDLAELLRSQNGSSLMQDKLTALIQPIREKKRAVRNLNKRSAESCQGCSRASTSQQQECNVSAASMPHQESGDMNSPEFTSVIPLASKGNRRYGTNQRNSPVKRAQLLKEDMDVFRDECKL